MIERIAILSLMITAIHIVMCDGMLLERLRIAIGCALDRLHLAVLKRPLYECLICMGGVYSLVLYPMLWGWALEMLPVMVGVIGLNSIIAKWIETDD